MPPLVNVQPKTKCKKPSFDNDNVIEGYEKQASKRQVFQKAQFLMKALNTFNQSNKTIGSGSFTRISRGSLDTQPQPLYKIPVYQENKQFFYDLAYVPKSLQPHPPVNKEVINESVYGKKWRNKLNQSVIVSGSSLSQHDAKKPSANRLDNSAIVHPKQRKNLNDLSSLFVSSSSSSEIEDFDKQSIASSTSSEVELKFQSKNYTKATASTTVQSKFRSAPHSPFKLMRDPYTKASIISKFNKQVHKPTPKLRFVKDEIETSEFVIESQEYPSLEEKKPKLRYERRVGEKAVLQYYKAFKNIKGSIERDEQHLYPQVAYMQKCEQNQIIPRPYGLVSFKGQEDELNIQSYLMGNKYANAYGNGLQLLQTKKVNLANNRLDEKGTLQVMQGLNKSVVEELDLSSNKIGIDGIEYLSQQIIQYPDLFKLRVLNLEHSQLTDQACVTLISAICIATEAQKSVLQELNLACNLITCSGAEKLAHFISMNPQSLRMLNVHWNKIKAKGGIKIADALSVNSHLKVLDLSWNALGQVTQTFAGQMTADEVKKKLKVQSINSQSEAMDQISELEKQQFEMQIGNAWGKALRYNKHLIHLDLSYNQFGLETCRIIQKKVKRNHSLFGLHMAGNPCYVDSQGFIELEEAETSPSILNQTIKKNPLNQSFYKKEVPKEKTTTHRTIMKSPQRDILFKRIEGMKAVIKAKHHSVQSSPIRWDSKRNILNHDHPKVKPILNKIESNQSAMSNRHSGKLLQKYKTKDNCWICEGWQEFKFELRVPQYIGAEVYLHFDFDNYKPDLMVATSAGVYQTHRMVPPGVHYYFMSVNGQEYFTTGSLQSQISDQTATQIISKLESQPSYNMRKPFDLRKLSYVESIFQQDMSTSRGNIMVQNQRGSGSALGLGSPSNVQGRNSQMSVVSAQNSSQAPGFQNLEKYQIDRIRHCVPRPDKKFIAQADERPRTPWTFPISLFKEYRPETQALVSDCFEFDWQCMKIPKLKKSTEEELKEKCRAIYPFVREIYKRLAALGVVGTIFSIGWNVYREFMIQTINVTDKDKLKPDDCDRLFIGVNAGTMKKSPYIPEKALVRFQFLEILVRAALKKYYESGDFETEAEALDEFIKCNLNPLKSQIDANSPYMYNQQRWRIERYWNEACDNIYKAFAPLFTYLYNTFGGTHKKPGQKTFMTLDEYDALIQTAGLINDLMNQRDIALHFNQAMMLQVNEIDQERHLQATYIEFLEAFARTCDQASIVIGQQAAEGQEQPDQVLTEEERTSMPLHVKIENAIQYLLKNCCPQKGFLDRFEIPKKHPQVGLYILPNKKFF